MQNSDFPQFNDAPTNDVDEVVDRLLPGVPAIESPFFSHHFPSDSTDPELMRIAKEMHTQGYSALSFPDSNLDQLSQKIINDLTPQFDFHSWRN
jgi:hypothetical protein